MISLAVLLLSLCTLLNAATLDIKSVYSIDGCDLEDSDWPNACLAFFCIDSDNYAQVLVSGTTLLMGNAVNGSSFEGVAAFGIGDRSYLESKEYLPTNGIVSNLAADIDGAVRAESYWEDSSVSGNWSTIAVQVMFFDEEDALLDTLYLNLTLNDERPFQEGIDTCLWHPRSEGTFDGQFDFTLGANTFSFYVCDEGDHFQGQAYGTAGPFPGPAGGDITIQYFINVYGMIVSYEGRRFYHGFVNFTNSKTTSSCGTSTFIYKPRVNSFLVVVTDNTTVPGSVEGIAMVVTPNDAAPFKFDGVPIFQTIPVIGGSVNEVSQHRFCTTSPQYLSICLGESTLPTEETVETTTEEIIETTELATTEVVETTASPVDSEDTGLQLITGLALLLATLF